MTAPWWESAEAFAAEDDRIPTPIPGQRKYPSPMAEIPPRQETEREAPSKRGDADG